VKRPLTPSPDLQKGEVHCTVINLSVTCLSLVVLSVSQAYSLRHDISKRLSLKINTVKIQKSMLYAVKSLVEDVCVFCFVFYGVFFSFFVVVFVIVVLIRIKANFIRYSIYSFFFPFFLNFYKKMYLL
jgi:hypothetical protein